MSSFPQYLNEIYSDFSSNPYIQQAITVAAANNLYIAAGIAAGIIGVSAIHYYLSPNQENQDLITMRKLSREIVELNPVIGDANAYEFTKTKGRYVNELATKAGSLSMIAAGLRANAKQKSYEKTPEEIVRLGQDLLKNRSGQCDHMAAAVIAKVVAHIRAGGTWNSDIELIGNGGHAFTIVNRKGDLSDPKTWGKDAIIVDTWLGALGVHEDYREALSEGDHGVISNPDAVAMHARFFGQNESGQNRLSATHRFTAAELHKLAQD